MRAKGLATLLRRSRRVVGRGPWCKKVACPLMLVAALSALPAAAQEDAEPASPEVRIDLAVEPREVTVGEPFSVTLRVEHPPDLDVRLPAPGTDWGSLTVRESGAPQRGTGADGWVRQVAVYRLAAFELGALEIIPLELEVTQGGERRTVATPAATIQVNSILPMEEGEGEEPQLADLKDQASLPLSLARVLALVALAVLLLAVVAYLLWRRRRSQPAAAIEAPGPPLPPPDREALQALQALLAGPLLAQGKIKEYHVQLAEIVKRYLERRFGVPTLERTSFEVVQATRLAPVDVWVPGRVASLLSGCDFVKFARQRPDVDRCRDMVDEARALVEQTRPLVPPRAAEQTAAGEG